MTSFKTVDGDVVPKTFFGGNLENLDTLTVTARIGYFKSNKLFKSIVLIQNIIVFTFLYRFRHLDFL